MRVIQSNELLTCADS